MTRPLRHITLFLLTVLLTASCATSNVTPRKTPSAPKAVAVDSSFIARASLSPSQQRDFDKLYLQAICHKLQGNNDAAFEMLRQALDINPESSEALYEFAILQLSNVERSALPSAEEDSLMAEAERQLIRAYELEPSNPYFRSTLAQHYLKTYNLEEAAKLYRLMANEKPTEENLNLLYRLNEAVNDLTGALETLDHMEQAMGYTEDIAIGRYRVFRSMGKPQEAFEAIERLCSEQPAEIQYRTMLADVYSEQGDTAKALALYREVLQVDSTELSAYYGIMRYYLANGNTNEFNRYFSQLMLSEDIDDEDKFAFIKTYAVSAVQKQAPISHSDMLLHFREGITASNNNEDMAELCTAYLETLQDEISNEEQVEMYKTVLDAHPDNYPARLRMLQHYVKQEDTEAIVTLCHEGTTYHPDELIFYYYEGLALMQLDRNLECIDAFRQGAYIINEDTDSNTASDLYALLGDIYHQQGMIDQAFDAYDKALEYNDNNIMCLNNFAYFLALENRQLNKALDMSKRTIEAQPNDATFLDTYAWVLYKMGQYTMAQINIDQAIKSTPEDELEAPSSDSLYDHAGDIYFKCGDTAKALDFWEKARKVTEKTDLINQLNKKIKNKKP